MRRITVSLDDNTYRTARIVAAERGTSVTAMVRDYLQSLRPNPTAAHHAALVATFDLAASTGNFSAKDRLSREDIHDRAAMQREFNADASSGPPKARA
jgi:plasmid stability protein